MKIKVGEYELIYTSTVIQFKDNPISIVLPDEIEGDFNFVFHFRTDINEKRMITSVNFVDTYNLELDFLNFDGELGAGNTELLRMGTLKKVPLFLNYRLFDLKGVGKTMIINFYTRKEFKDGE